MVTLGNKRPAAFLRNKDKRLAPGHLFVEHFLEGHNVWIPVGRSFSTAHDSCGGKHELLLGIFFAMRVMMVEYVILRQPPPIFVRRYRSVISTPFPNDRRLRRRRLCNGRDGPKQPKNEETLHFAVDSNRNIHVCDVSEIG